MNNRFTPLKIAELDWSLGHPRSILFDDVYFSRASGLEESEHVFIHGNKLPERWQQLEGEGALFVIGETGFGSGRNFLLAWDYWMRCAPPTARLHFISCEKHPLSRTDLESVLALWPGLNDYSQALLASYPILTPGFHRLEFAHGRVSLTLMLGDAADCYHELLICGDSPLEASLRPFYVDAWFLDGFAPSKNSAIWSGDLFYALALLSRPGSTFATYSVASQLRNDLALAGFNYEKIRGYKRKNEMLIGVFNTAPPSQHKKRITPWHHYPSKLNSKQAIVLGAGLAGCYSAYALAKRGWSVTLLDKASSPGQGASGNRQAVLYPKLSPHRSPLTLFMLSAFLHAHRFYSSLLAQYPIGELKGMLQLAYDRQEQASQRDLETWISNYPELGQLLSAEEASLLADLSLDKHALYVPQSGWIDSEALCAHLIKEAGIHWQPDTKVESIYYEEGQWSAAGHKAPVLIIASGYQASQFEQTAGLPLKPIGGQMTYIKENQDSDALKVPLCADGHILPAQNGVHATGATYHLGVHEASACYEDDLMNLKRLETMQPSIAWSQDIVDHWSAIRGATTDYLPLVGPVPKAKEFLARFQLLSSNARRWIPEPGIAYPGLYLCAGFGSRGLTTIPLAGEYLAALINQEPLPITRTMAQTLAPARFLRKGIVRGLS